MSQRGQGSSATNTRDASGAIAAQEASKQEQADKFFYNDEHFLEQIIHRSENCIIVANNQNKGEVDPVSYMFTFNLFFIRHKRS